MNENILVPSSIFNSRLSVFESVVRYLRDELRLGNKTISFYLGKSDKSVWQAYNNSLGKFKTKLDVKISFFIPISAFKGESTLFSVVNYLKQNCKLSYHEIALMLKRNDRTIWTVYNRKKSGENKTKQRKSK